MVGGEARRLQTPVELLGQRLAKLRFQRAKVREMT